MDLGLPHHFGVIGSEPPGLDPIRIQPADPRLTPTQKRYRRKLPSITETTCEYDSVRALLADIKDRVHQ
jgi:hypothetical protein